MNLITRIEVDDMSFSTARTILYNLQYGTTVDNKSGSLAMSCWGVNHIEPLERGVSFSVDGAKIRGHVEIDYQPRYDHYDIRIYDKSKILKYDYEGAYCTNLVKIIDEAIEKCTK
jgi:hypothetical protein